jgi:hypothetical protein
MGNTIEIYTIDNGSVVVEVRFENETVWLTQAQMAALFNTTKQNISLHLNNCFKEGELMRDSVVKEYLTTAADGKQYKMNHYNLDVIISVGYRVKSVQGTQFRIWATKRLKDYLVEGYVVNEKRLARKSQELMILKNGISMLTRAVEQQTLHSESSSDWLRMFTKGLKLLDDYDHETLDTKGRTITETVYPDYADYLQMVEEMYAGFGSGVFARPKDESFHSSIHQIKQSFAGTELYPSLEEKAANLLYFIVKNHSFVDGNKRIAAACFLLFLEKNRILRTKNGTIISNETLASLTLYIAVSKPEESGAVKNIIISVLNRSRE